MPEIDTIEAQVARDRDALSRSLDALTDVVNPSRASKQITAMAQEYGGEIGRQAWDAARQNPVAFAMVGAGLGLLLSGTGARPDNDARTATLVPPTRAMEGFDERVAKADAAMKEEVAEMSDQTYSASRMRAALDRGLEALPAPARKRVIKARQAALAAQDRVEAQAAKLARRSRSYIHEQPLAVGALALGLGALIGAILPPTRREDALLGEKRDALMQAAQRALSEELEKAQSAAAAKLDEVAVGARPNPARRV